MQVLWDVQSVCKSCWSIFPPPLWLRQGLTGALTLCAPSYSGQQWAESLNVTSSQEQVAEWQTKAEDKHTCGCVSWRYTACIVVYIDVHQLFSNNFYSYTSKTLHSWMSFWKGLPDKNFSQGIAKSTAENEHSIILLNSAIPLEVCTSYNDQSSKMLLACNIFKENVSTRRKPN